MTLVLGIVEILLGYIVAMTKQLVGIIVTLLATVHGIFAHATHQSSNVWFRWQNREANTLLFSIFQHDTNLYIN
jgi:hypothetical protein